MKKLTILLFLSFMLAGLGAQNFYDFKGVGARAAGMAFAFNAIADDATAMSWNPAGLTQLKHPEFSGIMRFQLEELSYEDLVDKQYTHSQEGLPYYTFDYFSIIYPFKVRERDLVFGVAYQNHINYKFAQTSTYPYAEHSAYASGNTTVNSISLCGAYALNNYLSVGLSFNKYFSQGKNNEASYLYTWPESYYSVDVVEVSSFSGFNVILGAFADMSSSGLPLKLAARLNTPLKLSNEFSSLTDSRYRAVPNIDEYAVQRKEGTDTYHIPFILGTGVSYRLGDYLTLAADFDIKPFKDAERTMRYDYYDNSVYDPPMNTVVDSTVLLVRSNDNLNQVRIGLEYILHPDFALIPIRIGWKNNPTNLANLDENGLPADQVFASSINAGFGIITKYYSVDFAYEYYAYEQEATDTFFAEHVMHSLIISMIFYLRHPE